MPKPQGKKNWKSQYNEHDFRAGESTRRVSFKPNRGGAKFDRNHRDWTDSVRAHLLDEDIDMGNHMGNMKNLHNKRFGKKPQRSGSPMPQWKVYKRKLLEGPISWYKITIPYGSKYEKGFLIKKFIDNLNPMPFVPIMWQTNGQNCSFYVDDFKVAEKIFKLDREISLPDGYKLIIKVMNGCPNVDVTVEMKEKMKLTMAKRYNSVTKALDLTKFHADPDLHEMFCALFKPVILLAVIDIIAENIPEIEAIKLDDNRITMLGHLKKLVQKLPNLKVLHLGNNKIKDVSQLDALIGLPIVDLLLDGNPLCDKFKDQASYISEIRKRFPKVMKLDGTDLPPPISFDIPDEVHFPKSEQTYLCNAEGQGIVRQFLEQYFQIMDSDNRQPLLSAYHENAMLSMTMCYPYGQQQKNSSWLNWYTTDNRNILRVTHTERRHKLLKQGQFAVVSFLQEMPGTKHDIHSFTVDLNLFTPQMLLLTVTGMFKELNSGHKIPPLRYFFRTLVIVPQGSGFCIANEELHISNATEEQAKEAFKAPAPVAPVTPVTPVAPVVIPDTNSSGVPPSEEVRAQMVQILAVQSGMNLEWSEKCLNETSWDFQKAVYVFTQLKEQGVIPPEAFIK